MDQQEVAEILEDLLNVMEEELERETLTLSFCDAWQNAEYLLTEL